MSDPAVGGGRPITYRMLHPPLRDVRFWLLQILVVGLAAAHLALDIIAPVAPEAIPAGIPVALLLAPIGYAALRYGLCGSAATAFWAILLWLPDLLLPHDRGHAGNDLIELALVGAVAVFVGYHIDMEHIARARAHAARSAEQAAQMRYRQLFNTNAAPILVASEQGVVLDANPAAQALATGGMAGRSVGEILGGEATEADSNGRVITVQSAHGDPSYYRINVAEVPSGDGEEPVRQLVLQDITVDRAEGDRVHRFAELLLQVQEDERRRIAQELHDEPLQLLVYLARVIEGLEALPGGENAALTDGLARARERTLDIAVRLRAVMSGLRPAALEQLGLVAALRGFLADTAETAGLRTELRVEGTERRLAPEVELGAFRIIQEAANNAMKHSQARHLLVTVAFGEREFRLRVGDDGRGFDPLAADRDLAGGHLGLVGMRERALLAGGELTVDSRPGRGTVIETVIPVAAPTGLLTDAAHGPVTSDTRAKDHLVTDK